MWLFGRGCGCRRVVAAGAIDLQAAFFGAKYWSTSVGTSLAGIGFIPLVVVCAGVLGLRHPKPVVLPERLLAQLGELGSKASLCRRMLAA